MKQRNKQVTRMIGIAAILLLAAGCGAAPSSEARAWIDVPLTGLHYMPGENVLIEGHAASAGGVDTVEIWVNGDLIQHMPPTSMDDGFAGFTLSWLPPGSGEYTIQAIAFNSEGEASAPDETTITVGEVVAEEITPTEVPEDDPTPTEVPEDDPTATPTEVPPVEEEEETTEPPPPAVTPVVQFWASPDVINAGDCTTISWHMENIARVIYAGSEQSFDGSYQDCFCDEQWLPMTVEYLDGSSEEIYAHITVNGTCETADTTPPGVPTQFKPTNGQEFNCTSSVILRWDAVSDPSGISEYRVEVQRHSGDNNWAAVSGSPFTGLTVLEKTLSVECGWYYRWRVRAIDGAGNFGAWSAWFLFTNWLT